MKTEKNKPITVPFTNLIKGNFKQQNVATIDLNTNKITFKYLVGSIEPEELLNIANAVAEICPQTETGITVANKNLPGLNNAGLKKAVNEITNTTQAEFDEGLNWAINTLKKFTGKK